jgi:hypothetical protein
MKKHKLIQLNYHNLNEKFEDDIATLKHEVSFDETEEIIEYSKGYFTKENVPIIFPAKSYCVAIIYSFLLQKYFGESFWDSLSDPNLFLGTDKFFIPYGQENRSDGIYNLLVKFIEENELFDFESSQLINVLSSVRYFYKEFSI